MPRLSALPLAMSKLILALCPLLAFGEHVDSKAWSSKSPGPLDFFSAATSKFLPVRYSLILPLALSVHLRLWLHIPRAHTRSLPLCWL